MKSTWTLLFFFASTSCIDNPIQDNAENNAPGRIGEFVSADGQADNDGSSANNGASFPEEEAPEGAVYRVLEEGLILNLNPYRGLQLIDFSAPSVPEIIGQTKIAGIPVEMYQVGNFVYLLLNNWWGYYGASSLHQPEIYYGGAVISVDISDRQNPTIVSRERVEGDIIASRLTRDEENESLYVVAESGQTGGTYVDSFSLSKTTGTIVPKTELALSGYVQNIQATENHLVLSRTYGNQPSNGTVSIIDISSPTGAMIEGVSIPIKGFTLNQSDMNIYDDILRVVSSGVGGNHIETFEVSDISNPVPIDHKTFAETQPLSATLFVANAAFITFRSREPVHIFSFSSTGMITDETDFVVSRFNSWSRPVNDNKRLIGVGFSDEEGNLNPAVSLYDIEDLKNPNPLLDREEIPVREIFSGTSQGASGEGNWDDRAFSVVEDAVNVLGPSGELETGLVLLPFAGWEVQGFKSGVQVFSFSETSITKRGLLNHDTPLQKSFVADHATNLVANISEVELTLHQTADLDAPNRVSQLTLSPSYSQLFRIGDHLIRRQRQNFFRNSGHDSLQIFDKNTDPEKRTVIAEFSIPKNARVIQAGHLLFTIESTKEEPEYEVAISVWDLSNPALPLNTSTFRTNLIKGVRHYDNGHTIDVVGNALVFSEDTPHENFTGTRHSSSRYYEDDRDSVCLSDQACSFVIGSETCWRIERLDGSFTDESCVANFVACAQNTSGEVTCEETPIPEDVSPFREATAEEHHNSLQRTFHILDFSDPTNLAVRTAITSRADEEAVNTISEGNKLHYTFKKRLPWPDNGRAASQYFLRTFDLTNPENPIQSVDLNIPGKPVAIAESSIFTHNYVWKSNRVQSSINRLELENNLAKLKDTKTFDRRRVIDVRVVPPNRLLVTHRPAFYHYAYRSPVTLSLLDSETFDAISEIEIDRWAKIEQVVAGRVLLTVSGGVLLMNFAEATPYVQSFFPLKDWSQNALVVDNNLFISANIFGIYKFDLDSQNLLQP